MAEQKPQVNPVQQQIQIELTPEVADGVYANYTIISSSNAEFVFDFIRLVPGVQKNKVQTRIIMTPQGAKNLIKGLDQTVKRYEETFGEIVGEVATPKREIGFQGGK